MIVVKLMGGLGNQMFQFAAGKALSLQHQCPLYLDHSFLHDRKNKPKDFVFREYDLDIFNLQVAQADTELVDRLTKRSSIYFFNSILNKVVGRKKTYYKQPFFRFDPDLNSNPTPLYIEGYFQSEKFFKKNELQIRNDFCFRHEPGDAVLEMAQKIRQSNAVCVNIRRGDFVGSSLHGIDNTSYYRNAEKMIHEKIKDPSFFIFSDDILWCKDNIRYAEPMIFVEHNYAGHKFSDYLYLMSQCKNFVIANSSFSWWAAWLNNNADKIVIAPKNWFGPKGPKDTMDLIPDEWIKI